MPLAAETARGLALGTGLRASAVSTSALAYSPAALTLGNLYHIEGNVDYVSALHAAALGAAVVDSSTSKVGAGISLRGFLSGNDRIGGLDGRLGLALSLSDAFSVGLSGRYIDVSAGGDPYKIDVQGFTMDASLRVMPATGLQLEIGALNFIDMDSPLVPVTLTGGIAVALAQSLSAGADVLVDTSTFDKAQFTLGGGVEYLGGETVPVRAGYSVDLARGVHMIGAGVGYTDERIGLDVGLRQEIKGGHDTRIMGAVRYYAN